MWQGEVAVSDSTIREKNLTVWNEVYEGVDVEELVSEVRGGLTTIADLSHLWVGEKGFWADPLVERFAGASVLELGAGTGSAGLLAAFLGATDVTIQDITPASRPLVEAAAQALGLDDRVKVVIGDIEELDLGTYDVVMARNLLHHIPSDEEDRFVARVAELTRPTGIARFADPAVNSRLLDEVRWLLPTSGRPSRLQRARFAEWQAKDPHPKRDNSTPHIAGLFRHHFGRVETTTAGGLARVHRWCGSERYHNQLTEALNRVDRLIPKSVQDRLASVHAFTAYEPIRTKE